MSRRQGGRFGVALFMSALVHAGVIGVIWFAAQNAAAIPQMRVYAVDIISPPPQAAGEPQPAIPAVQEPEPEPVDESAPEPEPDPEPEPARATEPSVPAPTRSEPRPEPRTERPREAPREEPREEPRRETPQPSRGADPDPTAAAGENLTVKFDGVRCIEPAYCDNIIRQIHRYFRRPSGGAAGEADLYFVIRPDGSVTDLRVISSTGGLPFRLAVMEAVEQAGRNKAFGDLPSAFGGTLPVRFTFRPAR